MSVLSGAMNASAAQDAASASAETAENSLEFSKAVYKDSVNNPLNQALTQHGTQAANALGSGISNYASGAQNVGRQYTMDDFKNSALYQSLMSANELAYNSASAQAAASGMLGSGNFASQLQENAQKNAALYENQAYNQWNTSNMGGLNALQSLAGLAQTSTNNLTNAGVQTASSMANTAARGTSASNYYNTLAAGNLTSGINTTEKAAKSLYNYFNSNYDSSNYGMSSGGKLNQSQVDYINGKSSDWNW